MLTKDFQIKFTRNKFQYYELGIIDDRRMIFTTASLQSNPETIYQDNSVTCRYDTHIIQNKKLTKLKNVRILSGATTQNEQKNHQNVSMLLCECAESERNQFKKQNQQHFSGLLVNLVQQNLSLVKFISPSAILKVNQSKTILYLQDLKWNKINFDIFGLLPKQNTAFQIKKKQRNTTVIDFNCNPDHYLNNLNILSESQLLLHIGHDNEFVDINDYLCKFDLSEERTAWTFSTHWHEDIMNKAISVSNNSFLNGIYNKQDNISSLYLFDFRVQRPVLKMLQSNSQDILRHPFNRILLPQFDMICQLQNPYSFLSLLSYRSGLKSLPYVFDIRKADSLSVIEMQDHFSHVKAIHYNNKKVTTVERQFKNFLFQKGKVAVYELEF